MTMSNFDYAIKLLAYFFLCVRPLHIAIVNGDSTLVNQILSAMSRLVSSVSVDQYNNLRQVRFLFIYLCLTGYS